MTDESRIDLNALDPDADSAAESRFVDGVMAQIAARPASSRPSIDPLIAVWSMMRHPALAAGIVIAIAVGAVELKRHNDAEARPSTVAEALGVPQAFLAASQNDR